MSAASSPTAAGHRSLLGAILAAGSAAAFGALAIFGKLAYEAGVTVLTLLVVRFVLAGLILSLVNVARRHAIRRPSRRFVITALVMGAIGYTAQSGFFLGSLTRIDAGLAALLLYLYPALVTLGAVALGRDRLDVVRAGALALAFAGLVLVLFVGGDSDLDALGASMAIASAVSYTCYILVADTVISDAEPLTLSALVCVGAALSFTLAGVVSGELTFDFDAIGWLWLTCIAVISTVLAVVLFFAGMSLIGPSRTSIISTIEPLVTVVLAYIVFSEQLSAVQLVGGALVLGSVVLLQLLGAEPEPSAPPA